MAAKGFFEIRRVVGDSDGPTHWELWRYTPTPIFAFWRWGRNPYGWQFVTQRNNEAAIQKAMRRLLPGHVDLVEGRYSPETGRELVGGGWAG